MTKHSREPRKRGNVIYERIYEVLLYDDTSVQNAVSECQANGIQYAFAWHDMDKHDDGTLKKKHCHFSVYLDREKSINSIAKMFGVPVNMVEWEEDKTSNIKYKMHLDDKSKYQYPSSVIVSNFDVNKYIKVKEKSSETEDLKLIMDYIAKHNACLSLYNIYCFAVENDIWSSYRRNYSIIKDMLQEARRCHSDIGYFVNLISGEIIDKWT